MKPIFLVALIQFLFLHAIHAQDFSKALIVDQNPNYELAMKSYTDETHESILEQGTTLQETYKAIDPLEDRRALRTQRRTYRANQRLWNYQIGLEQAKNGNFGYNYYGYPPNYFSGNYYTNDWTVPVSIGLGILEFAYWSSCFW